MRNARFVMAAAAMLALSACKSGFELSLSFMGASVTAKWDSDKTIEAATTTVRAGTDAVGITSAAAQK